MDSHDCLPAECMFTSDYFDTDALEIYRWSYRSTRLDIRIELAELDLFLL